MKDFFQRNSGKLALVLLSLLVVRAVAARVWLDAPASSVHVLPLGASRDEATGGARVVFGLRNTFGGPAGFVRVVVLFLDAEGSPVAEATFVPI